MSRVDGSVVLDFTLLRNSSHRDKTYWEKDNKVNKLLSMRLVQILGTQSSQELSIIITVQKSGCIDALAQKLVTSSF